MYLTLYRSRGVIPVIWPWFGVDSAAPHQPVESSGPEPDDTPTSRSSGSHFFNLMYPVKIVRAAGTSTEPPFLFVTSPRAFQYFSLQTQKRPTAKTVSHLYSQGREKLARFIAK